MTTTVFARLSALPDGIPVHFNIHVNPDRWGSKETILVLVGVAWVLTVLFYALRMAGTIDSRHNGRAGS